MAAFGSLADRSHVSVTPGEEVVVTVSITNDSDVVERYDFRLVGPASSWCDLGSDFLSLFPTASGTVAVRVAPPRSASVAAGPAPLGVRVIPASDPESSDTIDIRIDVASFTDLVANMAPQTSEGVFSGRHTLEIDNAGNSEVPVTVWIDEPDQRLHWRLTPGGTLAAGDHLVVNLKVTPGRRGMPGERIAFTAVVRAGDASSPLAEARAVGAFRQRRAHVARYLVPVVLLLAVAGFLLVRHARDHSHGHGSTTTTHASSSVHSVGAPNVVVSPSPNPATTGSIDYSVTVTGPSGAAVPTGSIRLSDGKNISCTQVLVGGRASCPIVEDAGMYTITTTYSGDAKYKSLTVMTTETVNEAAPVVTLSPQANAVAGPVTYEVGVAGPPGAPTPTGSVTISDSTDPSCTAALTNGSGTCSINETAGTFTITATYSGDSNYTTATQTATETVG